MGIFSAGDIVVSVLCLLMCIFFYLMGNSKRLEKVKKYGEKLMGEMKALADSAKEPLENFKIDLEVETKAAEQLLLRLKDVWVTVAGYEETLKRIEERLAQFQTLLSGLDRESAAVEENLLRIRDESVFADGVSGKIASARKRFDALEREIGHLKETMLSAFEKTSVETLEKSASAVLDVTRKTAMALQNEVEQKIGSLTRTADAARERVEAHLVSIQKVEEEQKTAIEESKKEVVRLAEDAVKNAGERSGEYEAQLFRQLRKDIDEKAAAMREKIESDWEAVQKASAENRDAIADISEEIENAKAGVRDAISRTAEEEEALWYEKLDEIKNEFNLFSEQTMELEARVKVMQEQIGGTSEKVEETLRVSLENAAKNAERFGDEKFNVYRAALEERLGAARNDFEQFSGQAADLEARVKAMQDQVGGTAEKIEGTLRASFESAAENAEKFGDEKFNVYRAALEERLGAAKDEFEQYSEKAADLEARVKATQEQLGGTAEKIEETLKESFENAAENAGKLGDEKFDMYRATLEEKISQFRTDADNSLSGMIERLNALVQNTGGEIRESVAVIRADADKTKADIESLAAEFEALKKESAANLNGEIASLEESIMASLYEKIEHLKSMQETEYLKFDAETTKKYRAAAEKTDEKWTGEFERLKETLEAFENTLRMEMDSAGENLGVYRNAIEQNMEELRKNMELALKNEIEKITQETSETLRMNKRTFEDSLKVLSTDVQNRIESVQSAIKETGEKSGEMLQTANEKLETTAQKIASLDAEIQNAQKKIADFSEQTKLFKEADNLKFELEHKIEDMEADIERLIQEKNALAGIEMQFEKIRRMEEETSTKITRFLAEQKRIDIMESDFNRLVKMSGDIEEKLRNISEENDMLEQVQVKLRKLSEAAEASEEKYQRVEKRNNIIETTNAGISANFKKLENAENRIETHKADIASIEKEIMSVKDALAKIKFENSEALKISTELSALDTSLAEIEERINKMQTAREWLADVETRMNKMYRDTIENLNRIDENSKRNLSGGTREKVDVLSPSLRDEVRRLKQGGWRVEAIARNLGISEGAVQLILEISAR
jgi:chromosome segregation ATPase